MSRTAGLSIRWREPVIHLADGWIQKMKSQIIKNLRGTLPSAGITFVTPTRIAVKYPSIPALLRQLSETGPPVTDAELLGRYAVHRDEDAFAALVRRHGRLVWSVCQHLAGSDADDAFQATFLVLLRNAGKAGIANKLSAWLYGVAYRVCLKARQSVKRRACREHAVSVKERDGSIVPDSL